MNSISWKTLLLLSFMSTLSHGALTKYKVTCKDENGKPLDWFSAYKLPKDSKSKNVNIQAGSGHVYLSDINQNFTLSSQPLNGDNSILGKTLAQIYSTSFNEQNNFGFVMYNDQFETMNLASRAHAKGVIFFDNTSAIWLVHSIPNFPPRPKSRTFAIADNQMIYGQSVMCLSLPLSSLDQIGRQMLFAWPQVYDSFIPAKMANNPFIKNLVNVSKANKYNTPKDGYDASDPLAWANTEEIQTLSKNTFATFYKGTKFNKDLYSDYVAPQLKSDLYTETWSNGIGGVLSTNCNQTYSVYNIKRVNFPTLNVNFAVNSDHSKWAISDPKNAGDGVFCIGDINRMASQFKRGGGMICGRKQLKAWQSYKSIVDTLEPCPLPSK